jgi:hypothetical protein
MCSPRRNHHPWERRVLFSAQSGQITPAGCRDVLCCLPWEVHLSTESHSMTALGALSLEGKGPAHPVAIPANWRRAFLKKSANFGVRQTSEPVRPRGTLPGEAWSDRSRARPGTWKKATEILMELAKCGYTYVVPRLTSLVQKRGCQETA